MKILLLQIKRIGDLILTTPAIRCLREAFPQARLTLVGDAAGRSLLSCLDVDETLVHDRRGGNGALWRRLFALRPDWCLDFSGTDRAAAMAFVARAGRRVAYERFRNRPFRRAIFSDFVDSSVRERHTADHHTDLLRPLGIERVGVPLDLRPPPESVTRTLLLGRGVPDRYAVIHAGTARPEKYWRPERWAAVADRLHTRHGLAVVFTGGAAPEEATHLAAIRAALRVPSFDLSGATDLAGLAGVIGGARLFCGVDTAAMHLADALRTPLVALFGPTNPWHWRPRHGRAVVLRALTEEPFDARQKGGPMDALSVDAVNDAVDRALSVET